MTQTDHTRIRVGDTDLGVMGLRRAIEEIASSYSSKSDAEVKDALLERLGKSNYIPTSARDDYGRAFVRAFRKALGQPYEDEADGGLRIAVLGPRCSLCDGLEQVVMQALIEMDLPAALEHVADEQEMARYGSLKLPALVVNGKIMASGAILSVKKIKEFLADLDRT